MTPRIFLFDLDGTLLLSGGAGMRAMEKAFVELHDLPDAFAGIRPDGKIDPNIFREIFQKRGLSFDDEDKAVADLEKRYIEILKDEMPTSPLAKIMPGVKKLLEKLSEIPDAHLGLVTGNFEQGAYIKLSRFSLRDYFHFGAFGSDHEDRSELVRIALKRAEKHLGQSIPMGKNVFVIGDTPKDIDCGKANGTTTVGVATANYSKEKLLAAGADMVFDDFSDVEAVLAAWLE